MAATNRACALALLLAGGCATTQAVPKSIAFELSDRAGKTVTLESLKGQVVLVDVWASWCKPCAASFPFYAKMQTELKDKGFTVVAISVDEDREAMDAFLLQNQVPFLILHDPKGSFPERMGVSQMPTAYLIGRDGAVVFRHGGFVGEDEADLSKRIRAAVGS